MQQRSDEAAKRWRWVGASGVLCALVTALVVPGCALLPPAPGARPIDDRLSNFPVEALTTTEPAEIRWSDRQIPFISAENDRDAAYLLGAAHAHLRESQMELLRRAAQGRLSETAGPFATDIDRLVRTLDLDRAVPAMAASLPPATRAWIESYCAGVNDYIAARPQAPPDLVLIGAGMNEPWRVEDVLAIGRLASVDISWGRIFRDARLARDDGGAAYLERMREFNGDGVPSFGAQEPTPVSALMSVGRTGSNSFAVAGSRTASGSAMIASDPHLGVLLPNLFLVVGYRTPQGTVVGMTFAGLPFVVIGRNEHIAWGGTNMLALSSVFYDVSNEPESSFAMRAEPLRRRWWSNFTPAFRDHELGPVITDAPYLASEDLPATALWWRGHEPSDEATAFLEVTRATNWDEFRSAFETYAVSGQNFVYADSAGNIGQVMAIEFAPAAGLAATNGLLADPAEASTLPTVRIGSAALPASFNPPGGVVVTANNVPAHLDPPITLGGNWNDRTLRIRDLLETPGTVTLDDLRAAQRDVYLISAHEAARAIVERGAIEPGSLLGDLASWDGQYRADSRGALVYEAVAAALIDTHYRAAYGDRGAGSMRSTHAAHRFIADDVASGAIGDEALRSAAAQAAESLEPDAVWGDRHRLEVRHPVGFVPVLGSQFRFGDVPADGTTGTVYKSAHGIGAQKHTVTYGAQSRHVSDMANPDENYFVLLGGQDGWLGSAQFLDMLDLWQAGEMVRVPMTEDAVRDAFPRRMSFGPGAPER
jgi:penicillin amidase